MNKTTSPPIDTACKNCGLQLSGRFCSRCSQDSEEGSPTARAWFAETFAEFTSIEGRSIRSIGKLLTRPGELTLAWMQGKRVRYTRPLRLVLFSLVLLLLVRSLLGSKLGLLPSAVLGFLEGGTGRDDIDAVVVLEQTNQILRWFTLGLAPIVAGIISLFFRQRTFSEHLVFTFHIVAFSLLVRTAFSFVELLGVSDYITEAIQMLAIAGYALVAMHRVYGESILRTSAKFIAIATLSVMIWSIAGIAIVDLALDL